MRRLEELNTIDEKKAIALIEPLIERSPSIAEKVVRGRPFQKAEDLSKSIREALFNLNEAGRVNLFKTHPELAPENPLTMTGASQSEQGRLDLTSDDNEFRTRLVDLNAKYQEKFGFPFITALVRHMDMQSVMAEFEARLTMDRMSEVEEAMDQILAVSAARVQAAFGCEAAVESQNTTEIK